MKANTKYTAEEILTEAKFTGLDKIFGKMRVRIAGISGIVKPDHLIRITPGTKEVEVIVGVETVTIPVESDSEDATVSEGAKIALEAKGALATKQAEKIAEAKKNPEK